MHDDFIQRAPPPMPTKYDQVRAEMTAPMVAVLDEDWADVSSRYMQLSVDPEVLAAWGPPDTSDNVFADMATALSQPGHYSREWYARHGSTRATRVVGPNGIMARSGYTSRMAYAERMAWALGDMVVHVESTGPGECSFHPVEPHYVYIEGADHDPSLPVVLWHLRLRYLKSARQHVWCWDQYSVRDPDVPYFRVIVGEDVQNVPDGATPTVKGSDITGELFRDEDGNPQTFDGDDYRWWDSAASRDEERGAPLIPYAIMRTVDSGRPWNYTARYGCFKTTLLISIISTYVLHAARDASGSMVVATGVDAPSTTTRRMGDEDSPRQLAMTPGSLVILPERESAKHPPQFKVIGPGVNLQPLDMYLRGVRARAAERFGISGGDAIRNDANPTSASALLITDKQKMRATRAADDLFRRFDQEILRIVSACQRAWGVEVPARGYSITYFDPPPTPAEQKEGRDQADWEVSNGYKSQVQVYMDAHPGTTRADAIRALAQVQKDNRDLARVIDQEGEDRDMCVPVPVDDYSDAVEELAEAADALEALRSAGDTIRPEDLDTIAESLTEAVDMLAGADDDEAEDSDDADQSGRPAASSAPSADGDSSPSDASTAPSQLNGAQVNALLGLLRAVVDGSLTREAAVIAASEAFPQISKTEIERAVDSQLAGAKTVDGE